jgi:predicted nucleic acid-binding protein
MLNSIDTGFLELLPLASADAKLVAAALKKYRDVRIQLADAALVHLAGRNGLDTIHA